VYVNQGWEEISGLSLARSRGTGWMDVLSALDIREMKDAVQKSVENQLDVTAFTLGITHPLSGLDIRHFQARLIFDESGTLQYLLAFAADPLPTPRAQDDGYYNNLLSSLEDIILELDLDKRFTNAWAKDESVLFMPKAAFLGKTLKETFGDQAGYFSEAMDRAIVTGKTQEILYCDPFNHTEKWYKAKIKKVDSSLAEFGRILVVIQDYTEIHMYETALKDAQNRMEKGRRLLEICEQLSLTSGWEYDLATRKVTHSGQAHLIYELENMNATADHLLTYFEPESLQRLQSASQDAITHRKDFDLEVEITTAKQHKKWIRVIGTPIIQNNEVTGLTGALMDITRLKTIALELTAAKNSAETAAKEKTEFLSIMSHEIRTPLNNIIGLLNLLKLDHTPSQEEFLNNLIFSSNHLLQLINDILDLHKLEAEPSRSLTPVDLHRLISDIRSQFIHFSDEKKLELIVQVDPQIPKKILADPTMLSQVLNNLISNAIKFTERGAILISAELQSRQSDTVTIHFSVRDTGIGIPHEFQTLVFETFKQLAGASLRKYPGTGLGLTITKRLIENQGSQIFVKSQPGEGTEFYFDLQFALPQPEATDTGVTAPNPFVLSDFKGRLPGIPLLLVDDNPLNLTIASSQLQYFGIMPDTANDAKTALERVADNTYQVILLDLHLPDMDGYRLAETIRSLSAQTRIIICTADVMHPAETRLAELGITEVLHKPFVPEELYQVLARALKQ
jgi:signal transduction histidine kinase/CheY-like chemotaxis protein